MSTTRDDLLFELYERHHMSYRESPSKEELTRMLTEANREREASNKRLKELEARLKANGIKIVPTLSEEEKEKKRQTYTVKKIDISNVPSKEIPKVLKEHGANDDPEACKDNGVILVGMCLGFIIPLGFFILACL